ncbi:hypothetical protein RRF57_004929 [Xylaria bambusicola]|uniref:NACHT domain-containing protein n=1 Tax=Xylaria bambusicola TaxID=326684 RepID=A0AAN7UJD3_9PEZI
MLLVSADPGCGKSVLAKYLVDHELSTTESRTTCYFFFKDDFADQRSSRSALSCILHQLFEQKEILLTEKIIERFEVHGEALTGSFVELWDILITSSRDQNAGEIICVLDAFDECEDQGQSELTRYLGNLYSMSNNFNLKFLITTRPYGHIRRGFQPLTIPGLPVIHLKGHIDTEASKISKEIDIYIKARCRIICKSLNLEKSEEALLLQNLLRIPHRTYLWAYLALDLIAKDINIDKTGIVKATSQLPQTVDEAYERILAKSLNVGETKKLLHIILAAARPLTVAEMNIALTIRKNHVSYTDLSLKSEAHFREYIRDLCGLFVTIIDSKIYLLHQTAKEFLAQDTPRRSPRRKRAKSTWKASLCTQESHRILAEICIWHLQFNEFKNNPLKEPEAVSNYLVCYKLLDYSAHNWARHFRASSMIDSAAVESVLKICANDYYCPAWFNIYWTSVHGNFPLGFSTLMIVCYFGIDQGVRILLKTGKFNINAKDLVYRRTALSWASENGFDGVVKLLLNSGGRLSQAITRLPPVDIEAKDVYGRTPLSYAARKGHTVIAKRLVKSKANTRSKDNVGGTPISYALCFGQDELVRVLLRGTPVNSDHNDLELLLSTAIEMDDVPTIMLLLDSGKINPSSGGKEGQPSLLYAVKNGKEDVVKLLLSRSEVAADLGDNNMRTPLSWAVQVGTKAIVKLLLESGKVNPDSKDNHGRTPLSYAAQSGNWKVVMFLIETGKVDVDSKDYHSCTPLSYAVQSSNWTIARFLIGTGKVDVDSKDYHGRTPLSYAAESSYRHIVKLLIESGKVDADSKDNHGRTPLSYAAESRYRHMVKLLIESGKVDADSKDNHGRTPLSYAAELGYRDIASCLIKSGKVDMDSKDKDGRTPLLWAVRSDSRDTAKFLIESGKVDADSKDKDGRTPLSWAVQPGNWHIAEFLIESGKADANSKDNHGRTPLSWAAQFGNRYAIDRLLVSGKVDSRLADNSGQTPEAYATRHNHHDVAKLLREWHDV